jgi:hypothetical protein
MLKRKSLLVLAAVIGFGFAANAQSFIKTQKNTLDGNDEVFLAINLNSDDDCKVKVYRSGNEIKYSNNCNYDVYVWYVYESRVCWNSQNGEECSKWSKSTTYNNKKCSANKTGTLQTLPTGSGIEYRIHSWDFE